MGEVAISCPKPWVEFDYACPPLKGDLTGLVCRHNVRFITGNYTLKDSPTLGLQWKIPEIIGDLDNCCHQMTFLPSIDELVCNLQSCRRTRNTCHARQLHTCLCDIGLNTHMILESHLVPMFVECEDIENAQNAFNKLVLCTDYSWAYLIQGYAKNRDSELAFELFQRMQETCSCLSKYTIIVLMKACAMMNWLDLGREVHTEVVKEGYESDRFIGSILVDIYMSSGSLVEGHEVFRELLVRDVVVWTALIGGYVEQGLLEEALSCYEQMQLECVPPDCVAYVYGLNSCSNLREIEKGETIHIDIVEKGFEMSLPVTSALVGMYAKGGRISEAKHLVHGLPRGSVVLWNALVAGYAEHGLTEEVLQSIDEMTMDGASPDEVTFVSILKACGGAGALQVGQEIHAHVVKQGLEDRNFIGSSLVDMYSKCGLLVEMCEVFEGLSIRDVVTWTVLIARYVDVGHCEEAWSYLKEMQMEGASPDALTFACILNGCASMRATAEGRDIHMEIIKRGMDLGSSICSNLVKMYAQCGLFTDARAVVDELLCKDHASWNALIGGLVEYALPEEALLCIEMMHVKAVPMDASTFLGALKACRDLKALEKGFGMHSQIIKCGLEGDLHLGNSLVDFYFKCCNLLEAQDVFHKLPAHDFVSWTVLIDGWTEHGHDDEVLEQLELMQRESVRQDVAMILSSVKACSSRGAMNKGQELHSQIVTKGLESDDFLSSSLVDMYAKCGCLLEAQDVLDELPSRNVVSWTALIGAYAEWVRTQDVLRCYNKMQSEGICPNAITYVLVLKACKSAQFVTISKQLHSEIVKVAMESNSSVSCALVELYAMCGLLTEAQNIFDGLSNRDALSWNALIGGQVEHNQSERALQRLQEMQIEGSAPDDVTYICGLRACGQAGAMDAGRKLYSAIVKKGMESDLCVSTSLVDMYAKLCALQEAQQVFDGMSVRDQVVYSSLIAGYSEHGLFQEAWNCFEQMQATGILPDVVTWNALLCACAEQEEYDTVFTLYSCMLEQGVLPNEVTLLCFIETSGRTSAVLLGERMYAQWAGAATPDGAETVLATALIDMYSLCGSITKAQQIFDTASRKDTAMCNSLIAGYSRQGETEHALSVFESMKSERVEPDAATFLCILASCSHVGLLEKAQECFKSMSRAYGISPSMEHYNCVVDLLGRAGHLGNALTFVNGISEGPNHATMNALLRACQERGDIDAGKEVFKCAARLDERHAGAFVLMSNMYGHVTKSEES